jgi:branched-chain amino acid transport system substrate-binding protein
MGLVAEGLYERNTTAVKGALLAIKKGNPQAVIMIGAYRPCAEFIKLARQVKMDATFVNISFVGSEAFAKELGAAGEGVVVTQVVPSPYSDSPDLVKRYRAALNLLDVNATPGFISLEGYLVGRLAIAALERIDGEPTRQKFLDAMTKGEFDFGGMSLSYSITNNQGSNQVFLTVIQSDGSFKPVSVLPQPAS